MPFILLGFHRLSKRLALLPPSKLLLRWTNSNGNPMKSLMFNRKYMWIVGCHTNLATIKSWLFTDVHKTERPSDALDLRSKGDIKVMLGGDVSGVLFQEGFKLCFPAVREKSKNYPGGFCPVSFSGGILYSRRVLLQQSSLRQYTCYTHFMEPKMELLPQFRKHFQVHSLVWRRFIESFLRHVTQPRLS